MVEIKNASILVVDDEETILQTIKRDLGNAGYKVETARSGKEALAKFYQSPADLVLTDLVMENGGGMEALREVRRTKPDTMVILMTGFSEMHKVEEAMKPGAYDFLRKPFDRGELRLKIVSSLEKQAMERSLRRLNDELAETNDCLIKEIDRRDQTRITLENQIKEFLGEIRPLELNLSTKYSHVDEALKKNVAQISESAIKVGNLPGSSFEQDKEKYFESVAPVDLNRTLAEALQDFEDKIAVTGGSVESEPLPTVQADPVQMRRLFHILIDNALKFRNRDESPRVKISSVGKTNGSAHIKIQDNGIGFNERFLERIFLPVVKLHAGFEGLGMGLAIAQTFVGRHGGKLTARSQPGQGAAFDVVLPSGKPDALK